MAQIKLISNNFDTLTGEFGCFQFVDGVSEDMSMADAKRFAASMQVRMVVDGVVTDINPSDTQMLADLKAVSMPVVEASIVGEVAPVEPAPVEALNYDFTQEDLEKLADDGGITGLREIANKYDVRGTAIAGIIKDLMAKKAASESTETN